MGDTGGDTEFRSGIDVSAKGPSRMKPIGGGGRRTMGGAPGKGLGVATIGIAAVLPCTNWGGDDAVALEVVPPRSAAAGEGGKGGGEMGF
jgi:hypothetical protein